MVELERGLNESQIRYITHEVFVGLEYLHSLKGKSFDFAKTKIWSLTFEISMHLD